MALRNIVTEGDIVLRKVSREVTSFGARTNVLIDDMRETLIDANGLGLAAPQVGVLRRVVLIVDNDGEMVELINPVILSASEETEGTYEGCLSVPGERGWLERSSFVKVRAQDRYGNEFEREFEHMAARAALHETDHLDGKLFIDFCDELFTDEELDEMLSKEE